METHLEMLKSFPRYEFHDLNQYLVNDFKAVIRSKNEIVKCDVNQDVITLSDDNNYNISEINYNNVITDSIKQFNFEDFDEDLSEISMETLREINVNDFVAFLLNDSSLNRLKNFVFKLIQQNRNDPLIQKWANILVKEIILIKIQNNELDSFFINIVREFSENFVEIAISNIYLHIVENDNIQHFEQFFSNVNQDFQYEFFQKFLSKINVLKEVHLKLIMKLLQTNKTNCIDVVIISKLIKLMEVACRIPSNNELLCNVLMLIIQNLNEDMIEFCEPIENILKMNTSKQKKIVIKLLTIRKNKFISKN